jgi:alpha-beta hydrolase superfamily lysophospholipase
MTVDPTIPAQDFSLIDRPEVVSVLFYPRPDASPPPAGARDLMIPVAGDERVHARWYPLDRTAPAVLFFHGNGEVAADYDDIAPLYHRAGLSLFVADYRGYGRSEGRPAMTTMLADAIVVADAFHATLDEETAAPARFIMGRSLGGLSAVELAARRPAGFRGLILESATAGARGWDRFARPGDDPAAWAALLEGQRAKLRAIALPLLSIHGEWDELIPVQTAVDLQQLVSSDKKELEIIAGAGHNDLLYRGLDRYFGALAAFVRQYA